MSEEIIRTEFDLQYGDRYRTAPKGDSSPTVQKWIDFEAARKEAKRKANKAAKQSDKPKPEAETNVASNPETTTSAPANTAVSFNERDEALIKVLNEYYGASIPSGQRHPRFTEETSHWMCWVCDNDPEKAIAMSLRLDWVKDWKPNAGEVEDLVRTASKKKLLTHCPKALKELLAKVDGEAKSVNAALTPQDDGLPFEKWTARIESLFDKVPCLREVCEPHPKRLWVFLFIAAAALMGTLMTLCWYRFYDRPEKRRRLNYNVLGIGDPASGKNALERIVDLLCEPIMLADKLVNDTINAWKEEQRMKGANKDKNAKPKGIVRMHGARTANGVFINDMVNAWIEVDGERVQMHLLTVDTEALNNIKMGKGGQWIDKSVMEIKAWNNETDSQQYANLDSVTGFFQIFWNLVRTCTPTALNIMCNDRNFGTGYPTRLSPIPVPGTGFQMMELRTESPKALEADETLREWAYKLDKRQGELPLWPLVVQCWHWTNDHMEIAAFNNDKADELLLKRVAQTSMCLVAPWVDLHHWEEREKNGTYEIDDVDKELMDLVLDIQYRTQHHYFGELARKYFDDQQKEATIFCRRTTRYELCFQKLPDNFTTDQFVATFNFVNTQSANKALNRFLQDKSIERVKRGVYKKRVQSIS